MKTSRPLVIINIIIKRRFDNLPGSPVLSCIVYMQFICYLPKSNMLNTRHRYPPVSFNQFLSSCINVKLNNPIKVKSEMTIDLRTMLAFSCYWCPLQHNDIIKAISVTCECFYHPIISDETAGTLC